jgi:DNA-binding CsgD family transcriptional regulator
MLDVVDAASRVTLDDVSWMCALREALRRSRAKSIASMAYTFATVPHVQPGPAVYDDDMMPVLNVEGHAVLSNEQAIRAFCVDAAATSATATFGGELVPELASKWRPRGVEDVFGLLATVNGHGLLIATAESSKADARSLRQGTSAAKVIRLTLELKNALQGRPIEQIVSAIFEPSGACAHAHPRLASRSLKAIRDAVALREAQRNLATTDFDAATVWAGLCLGRYRLVDHVDRDGRRYVVMLETAQADDSLPLTRTETRIAELCGQAFSNKQIGYELGMTESAVENHLSRALRKLRLESRADLIRLYTQLEAGNPRRQDPGVVTH